MGGYSSGSSGGPSGGGTSKQAKNYAKKNEPNIIDKGLKKIKDKIYGGPEKGALAETYDPYYGEYDAPGTLSDPREKDDTAAKASLFKEQGATNYQNSWMGKTMVGALLSGPIKESTRANRSFFKNEVLGKGAFKGTTVKDFERKTVTEQEKIYKNYIEGRGSGKIDAYGRSLTSKENNQKSIEQPKVASQMDNSDVKSSMIMADKTAPTDIEFTQDQALDIKKRGRKRTILTSVTGDTSNVTLGKKTLLGS